MMVVSTAALRRLPRILHDLGISLLRTGKIAGLQILTQRL